MNKKALLGLVFSIVVIVAVMAYLPFPVGPVGAQDTGTVDNELRGWAWSDSTGWVSFNHEGTDGMISSGGTSSGSTEYKMPSSATQKIKTSDSLTWVNPAGSLPAPSTGVAGATVSFGSKSTNYLENRGFGLSLPAGANVTGIEVCYERSGGARILEKVYEVYDEEVRLIKPDGSYSQGNKSQSSPWGYAPEGEYLLACYGGSNDTWGENWTPTDIASPNFGTTISAYLSANDWILTAKIDAVKVKVYYEEPTVSPAPSGLDYAVIVDQNENLTGYAWSLNLGWIKFAPELYPTGVCGATNDCYGAKIVKGASVDEVKGWARVCSVYQSDCSGTLRSDSELGGWDGWIRMHNVKRQANGGYFGYAWGDLNLAWLNFGFGFSDDDGGPDDGTCDPTKQVCGGTVVTCDPEQQCCIGDTYPENPNCGREAMVIVNGQCVGEAPPFFEPAGDDCGFSCQTYSVNEEVTVGFQDLEPGTIASWSSTGDGCINNENNNSCTISSLTQDTRVTANCVQTPLNECSVMISSGTMSLVEGKNLDYTEGVLSNAAKVVLKTDRGVPCQGTYNLESSILDGPAGLSILCLKNGSYSYDCTGLDGASETLIKARFTARPAESPSSWDVIMRATRDEESSQSKTYKKLIRYQRKAAN